MIAEKTITDVGANITGASKVAEEDSQRIHCAPSHLPIIEVSIPNQKFSIRCLRLASCHFRLQPTPSKVQGYGTAIMSPLNRTANSAFRTPSRRHARRPPLEECNRDTPSFLRSHHLIITTTRAVYAWDMSGVIEIFRSGSEGIVAAKKLAGSDGTLAVADSQVVVLHDITKRMQRSYRLKGSEVGNRLIFCLDSRLPLD